LKAVRRELHFTAGAGRMNCRHLEENSTPANSFPKPSRRRPAFDCRPKTAVSGVSELPQNTSQQSRAASIADFNWRCGMDQKVKAKPPLTLR
jgi:hypothetical protein